MTDWAAYKRKQREAYRKAGLVAVTVWIPPQGRADVHALAEKLRADEKEEQA